MSSTGSSHMTRQWAVLVGVDDYRHRSSNLQGCVNDALLVNSLLRDVIEVPNENTRLFLSKHSSSSILSPDVTYKAPKAVGFLQALDEVMGRAVAGDFVYIHFSGHGSRGEITDPSQSRTQGGVKEERLEFEDQPLPDWEFGKKLDEMTARGLTLLVVLDCCFSGGATRDPDQKFTVRAKPQPFGLEVQTRGHRGASTDGFQVSQTLRDAVMRPSSFYRDRGYNTMAACQPHETAVEVEDGGKTYGAFTLKFVSGLRSLQDVQSSTTYAELYDIVETTMRSKVHGPPQRPVSLGPQTRFLFRHDTWDAPKEAARVLRVQGTTIMLSRGRLSGAKQGDTYRLRDFTKPAIEEQANTRVDDIQVVITTLRALDSDAKLCIGQEESQAHGIYSLIKPGWAAELARRAHKIHVRMIQHEEHPSVQACNAIQQDWPTLADATLPIELLSPGQNGEIGADFHVDVHSEEILILDKHGNTFDHLPTIRIQQEALASKLMRVLGHLSMFQYVKQLIPTQASPQQVPMFTFSLKEVEPPEEGEVDGIVCSSWNISFCNQHPPESDQRLYITVFNLKPLHGIRQLYPIQNGASEAVDPGCSIEFTMDIVVPKALEQDYRKSGFRMRDVFKVFVTTKPTKLNHLSLPDLATAEDARGSMRDGAVRGLKAMPPCMWWVGEKEIDTSGPTEVGEGGL